MARKENTTSDNVSKRANEPAEVVTYWLNEIGAARKREKDFRKEGQRVIDIYDGKKSETTPYNILFSNTEIMLPALYSSVPRPIVQRRFKDEDPLGKAAAMAGQRGLEFMVDTNVEGYETFDQGMRMATLDGLLPGRGVTCVKYDFEEGDMDAPEGAAEDAEPTPYKKSELACVETRSWNRVFFGYAKKWSKVPWVAYEEHIDREEAERLFGEEIASKIVYTTGEEMDNDEDKSNSDADDRNTGERKTALVYQIWDKDGGRKVRYISAQFADGFLSVKDDPLGLTGFFNCPKPIAFLEKSNDLLPVALYALYENQAKELNRLTVRINRIVEAMKARGVYDSELGEDISNLMKADDNALVPADKSSSLAAEKGLQNAIWFMPLDVLSGVLDRLYIAREQCKAVIYEIMGISDIIRGSSKASETFGAQELKSQWGTMRLKPKQTEVQRYAHDLLRMLLEIAATKFSEETWAKMTGLPFVTTTQRQQLEQVMQAAQLQAQQMAAAGQQPTPQQMESFQQLQAELAKPVWGKVLELLRDDTQRAYRIDIETNSTVLPEAVEDQKNIGEVMAALGQYLNGVTPLITSGAMPFEAAQAMMLSIVRRFRFGGEIEDSIKAMKAPTPPDDGKAAEAAAAQAEQAKQQAEIQKNQADNAADVEKEKVAAMERDAEATRAHEIAMAKVNADAQAKIAADEQETLRENARLATEERIKKAEAQSKRDTAANEARVAQETELQKASIAAAAQVIVAQETAKVQAASDAKAEGENAERDAANEQSGAAMQESIRMMAEALRQLAAPKAVERDKNGKIMTLVPQTAKAN